MESFKGSALWGSMRSFSEEISLGLTPNCTAPLITISFLCALFRGGLPFGALRAVTVPGVGFGATFFFPMAGETWMWPKMTRLRYFVGGKFFVYFGGGKREKVCGTDC